MTQQQIAAALENSGGTICSAAYALGVSASRLAVDMQRLGMRFDLSEAARKRIGTARLDSVRKLLQDGIPKKDIASTLDLSEWTMQLIELDRPTLREKHRAATIDRQRESHRLAILTLLRAEPDAARTHALRERAAAMDWLRRYDRAWLDATLPASRTRVGGLRNRRRVDWESRDAETVVALHELATKYLANSNRPVRVTKCLLLRRAGGILAVGKGRTLMPNSLRTAETLAEARDAYLRRRIHWALLEYRNRHVPLSMNQFRRTAGLRPADILVHKKFVRDTARKLGLTFDQRCALAES
jgi:hypothetical protein